MFTLAITGDFNAGKSTVRRFLSRHGWTAIDCDAVVHALYRPGAEGHRLLRQICGPSIFFQNGNVNRRTLGRLITINQKLRIKIENAIHPLVYKTVRTALKEAQQRGVQRFCIEIPVYDHALWHTVVDGVLWITAPAATVSHRLPADKRHLAVFLKKKVPPSQVFVIKNTGHRSFLYPQIQKALVSMGAPR